MTRFKPDIEKAKERVEAWWNNEIVDRAVVQVTAPRNNAVPYTGPDTNNLETYWTDPSYVMPRWMHQVENTCFTAEAFPIMFPAATGMPAMLARYLGSANRFIDKNTAWVESFLDDWATRQPFRFTQDNKWFQITKMLLEAGVTHAESNELEYFVGLPDLNGPTEVFADIRGPEKLAMDFIDSPDMIKPALAEINQAWFDAWKACTAITQRLGGFFFWMRIWSERPAIDLQSDFSCMISKTMFDEYFMPFIEQQTQWVERTIYHLDGPGAVQHLDSLLDLPNLTGIQWIPGAGQKPASEWPDLLRKIQDAGKLVYCYCGKNSIEDVLSYLKPEGVMLVTECGSEAEADELIRNVEKWSARNTMVTV